ncbi:MAG: hypothetical protein J7521_20190 [Caulobacter sp.]|nr:hypothetical protein [Caulobacter sp.]
MAVDIPHDVLVRVTAISSDVAALKATCSTGWTTEAQLARAEVAMAHLRGESRRLHRQLKGLRASARQNEAPFVAMIGDAA